MVQANQPSKAVLTLGEKWQSFASSKLQQHHPQKKILLFRENLLKKVIKLLDKWQINDSDLPQKPESIALLGHEFEEIRIDFERGG